MESDKHLFQFPAFEIAAAAQRCVEHHQARLAWWDQERQKAFDKLKDATVTINSYEISGGGRRTNLSVNSDAIGRVNECEAKHEEHTKAIREYQVLHALYSTQGVRVYDLDGKDVEFFRLAGQKAPD